MIQLLSVGVIHTESYGDELSQQLTKGSIAGLPIRRVIEKPLTTKMLIYGKSGTGKTVLGGSASAVPEMSPVLILDLENGTNSLRTTYPDVDTIRVRTWAELNDVLNAVIAADYYRTIVIDSLSEAQKFNMYHVLARAGINPQEEKSTWDEYNSNLESMRIFVRTLRDLENVNVIMLALIDESKDKKTGLTIKRPLFGGKFILEVTGLVDEVFLYYVTDLWDEEEDAEVPTRCLLTSATETADAKDRSGSLPQLMVKPTMAAIYKLMSENKPETETKESNENG